MSKKTDDLALTEVLAKASKDLLEVTEDEYNKTDGVLLRDRLKLLELCPFYGELLLSVTPYTTTEVICPIAAINYKSLIINGSDPGRMAKLKDKIGSKLQKMNKENPISLPSKGIPFWELSQLGRETVLAHEVCHLVFDHLTIPRGMNANLANIAQDAVINRILYKDPYYNELQGLPEGCVRPIKSSSKLTGFTIGTGKNKKSFTIEDYENKDWYAIYKDLFNEIEKSFTCASCNGTGKQQNQNGSGNQESQGQGSGDQESQGQGSGDQESSGNQPCSSCGGKSRKERLEDYINELSKQNPMQGDTSIGSKDPSEKDSDDINREEEFKKKIIEAYQTAKNRGTEPAGMQRIVDELTDSKLPWHIYLRRLIKTEIVKDDFTFKPNSRRAHLGGKGRPSFFPKVESEALGDVFCVLDTSGSMSYQELRDGLSEFDGMRQAIAFNLLLITCDAQAYKIQEFDRHSRPDWSQAIIEGGGGTSFVPPFRSVEKWRKENVGKKPALLVYFTDGYGDFPSQPPDYPVIWVCTSNLPNSHFPFGRVVNMGTGEYD